MMPIILYSTQIIKSHSDLISPPKQKFHLCLNREKRLFFLINSKNRSMYYCFPILKSNHSFLKHDSFIACNRTFNLSEQKLLELRKIEGSLSATEVDELTAHLNNNVKTLSPNEKALICNSLKASI